MFRGHGDGIRPATPAGFSPLRGGLVIMLTLFEARVEHDAPSTMAWSMVGQRVALYSLPALNMKLNISVKQYDYGISLLAADY